MFGLELNRDKTRIVYCKDADRKGIHEYTSFDFLGYTFRPRQAKNRYGKFFANFLPAMGKKAKKVIRKKNPKLEAAIEIRQEFDGYS